MPEEFNNQTMADWRCIGVWVVKSLDEIKNSAMRLSERVERLYALEKDLNKLENAMDQLSCSMDKRFDSICTSFNNLLEDHNKHIVPAVSQFNAERDSKRTLILQLVIAAIIAAATALIILYAMHVAK